MTTDTLWERDLSRDVLGCSYRPIALHKQSTKPLVAAKFTLLHTLTLQVLLGLDGLGVRNFSGFSPLLR
jgi:hypothetical protein